MLLYYVNEIIAFLHLIESKHLSAI